MMPFADDRVDYARWSVWVDRVTVSGSDLNIIEDEIYPLSNEDFETSWSVGGGAEVYFAKNSAAI